MVTRRAHAGSGRRPPQAPSAVAAASRRAAVTVPVLPGVAAATVAAEEWNRRCKTSSMPAPAENPAGHAADGGRWAAARSSRCAVDCRSRLRDFKIGAPDVRVNPASPAPYNLVRNVRTTARLRVLHTMNITADRQTTPRANRAGMMEARRRWSRPGDLDSAAELMRNTGLPPRPISGGAGRGRGHRPRPSAAATSSRGSQCETDFVLAATVPGDSRGNLPQDGLGDAPDTLATLRASSMERAVSRNSAGR